MNREQFEQMTLEELRQYLEQMEAFARGMYAGLVFFVPRQYTRSFEDVFELYKNPQEKE